MLRESTKNAQNVGSEWYQNFRDHQDLFTEAVAKCGWWIKSKEILSDGSRLPNRQRRFRATWLCSATCSIWRSSANLPGSLAKLPRSSFAIFCASLKQLCTDRVWQIRSWSKFVEEDSLRMYTITNTYRKASISYGLTEGEERSVIRKASLLQQLKVLDKSLENLWTSWNHHHFILFIWIWKWTKVHFCFVCYLISKTRSWRSRRWGFLEQDSNRQQYIVGNKTKIRKSMKFGKIKFSN